MSIRDSNTVLAPEVLNEEVDEATALDGQMLGWRKERV